MESHSTERVLLVGLASLKGKLLCRGFIFEEAVTGEEALEKAGVTKFQTIVLDVDVPGMDGIGVARRLREENSSVKILLVSGIERFDECIEALEIGIEDIVMKPIEASELLNLLRDRTG